MRFVVSAIAAMSLFSLAWTQQVSAQYPGYPPYPYTSMYPSAQHMLPAANPYLAPPIQMSFYGSYGGYNPATAYAPQWPAQPWASQQPVVPPRHCEQNRLTPTQAYYSNNYYLQQPVQTPHRWHLGHFLMGPH